MFQAGEMALLRAPSGTGAQWLRKDQKDKSQGWSRRSTGKARVGAGNAGRMCLDKEFGFYP